MSTKKSLSKAQKETLLEILNSRFEKNMNRHKGIEWKSVLTKLEVNADKLWSLNEMEETGGEPDVVAFDKKSGEYTFMDCAPESPKGRRSICYDQEALNARKEYKPANSAINMAAEMVVEVLTEDEYKALQQLGKFDSKTSSWLKTPANIRKLGGAIFADYRFETIFVYHNGAESYYGGRAFRGKLQV